MADLAALQKQLNQPGLPPVEQWHPDFCGDMPLRIDSEGQWFYQDSKITRPKLVQLFATVLLQQDGEYFLQTPVEKLRIQVDDAPFVAVDWQWLDSDVGKVLAFTLNLGQQVLLSAQYPLVLRHDPQQQLLPYLQLWHGLSAKLSRNVYYQLVEQADIVSTNQQQQLQLQSGGDSYVLGIVDAAG